MTTHVRFAILFGVLCGIVSGIGIKLIMMEDTGVGVFTAFAGFFASFFLTLTPAWGIVLTHLSPYVYRTTVAAPWSVVVMIATWVYVLPRMHS